MPDKSFEEALEDLIDTFADKASLEDILSALELKTMAVREQLGDDMPDLSDMDATPL